MSVWLHVHHSFHFRGRPLMYNNARGTAQLAQRSMKSQNGSPAMGRANAVRKPQIVAYTSIKRNGYTKASIATMISSVPIRYMVLVAVLPVKPVKAVNISRNRGLSWRAKMPWPRNSPNRPRRRIHSIILSFFSCFIFIHTSLWLSSHFFPATFFHSQIIARITSTTKPISNKK